jgi:hypothetical protein
MENAPTLASHAQAMLSLVEFLLANPDDVLDADAYDAIDAAREAIAKAVQA